MSINQRLNELRKSIKLTQSDFGSRIGIKHNTVGQMESGDRTITDRTIMGICKEFNVNEEWFRTGEGDMYNKVTTQSQLDDLSIELNLSTVCDSILNAYSKMDEKQQKTIDSFLNEVIIGALKKSNSDIDDTSDIDDSEFDIDEELEDYRKELETEKRAKEKSKVLEDTKEA